MKEWDKLQPIHMDFLREIGNIGAGNAVTSLAQMTGKKIDMEVPYARITTISQLFDIIGDEEELVSCINLAVNGDAPSTVFFLLKHSNALKLIDRLMGLPSGSTKNVDEMAQSVLNEIGNILTGSMINAMGNFTGLNMQPSVPAFANDMLGAVLSAALLERGYFDDNVLIIDTRFFDDDVVINGYLFMVPHDNALEIIFKSVGINM